MKKSRPFAADQRQRHLAARIARLLGDELAPRP